MNKHPTLYISFTTRVWRVYDCLQFPCRLATPNFSISLIFEGRTLVVYQHLYHAKTMRLISDIVIMVLYSMVL